MDRHRKTSRPLSLGSEISGTLLIQELDDDSYVYKFGPNGSDGPKEFGYSRLFSPNHEEADGDATHFGLKDDDVAEIEDECAALWTEHSRGPAGASGGASGDASGSAPLRSGLAPRWFEAVSLGEKTVEGRLAGGKFGALGAGQEIVFRESGAARGAAPGSREVRATITRVAKYPGFREMIEAEGIGRVLPGVPGLDAGVAIYREFYTEEDEKAQGVVAVEIKLAPAQPAAYRALEPNSTSYSAEVTQKLRKLYEEYTALRASPDATESSKWASHLRYSQYLVRAVLFDGAYGVRRGILANQAMGMGKTQAAIACAMSTDKYEAIVISSKSIHATFGSEIEKVAAALGRDPAQVLSGFSFVSADAYNAADQLIRLTLGLKKAEKTASIDEKALETALNGKLLIIDEAHNFFRAIINSAGDETNARRIYRMIMTASDVKLLFLTGTVPVKHVFELAPCFALLAGYDILPVNYNSFMRLYVDSKTNRLKNREYLANRLMGFVSYVTPLLPTSPGGEVASLTRKDGGFPEDLGTTVLKIEMGPEQYGSYLSARDEEERRGGAAGTAGFVPQSGPPQVKTSLALPSADSSGGSTYYVRSRQLSTFAPPFEFRKSALADLPDSVFTKENGPKLAKMVEKIESAPGTVLVFSEYVGLGGLGVAAKYLDRAGFTEWRPASEAPASDNPPSGGAPPSGGKRYAFFRGDTAPEDRVRLIREINSDANTRGGVIKVIFVSRAGAEGINLENIRMAVFIGPGWDKTIEEQAKARAFRMGSHDRLPVEDRDVASFLLLASANKSMEARPGEGGFVEPQTIDERLHERALKNMNLIRQARDLLRSVSFECVSNNYANCYACKPTNVPLFIGPPQTDNMAYGTDIRRKNPCERFEEREEELDGEFEVRGVQYGFARSLSESATRYFRMDAALGGWVPVHPSATAPDLWTELELASQNF